VNGTLRSRARVLGEQGLAAAGRTDQQDVALGQLHVLAGALARLGLQPLVVVVHRDRQHLLGTVLADDVFVEDPLDLLGLGELLAGLLRLLLELLADDVVTELDALVADENRRTGNQLTNFMLALAAEGTVEKLAVVVLAA
jgi:hypothetical protein